MAYGFYTAVTIDNTKVADDHVNFPILVAGTFDGTAGEADLRTVANGGNINNVDTTAGVSGTYTVPADFVFSPNTDGSSPYDFEFEKYNAVTGEIVAWVRIPLMDADADVTFYMVYGDSVVVVSQEDVNGTWNANYKAVYHMAEASSNILDSTSGGHDSTSIGGTPDYRQAGRFGYAVNLAPTEYFVVPDHADFTLTDMAIELVVHIDDNFRAGEGYVYYKGTVGADLIGCYAHNGTGDIYGYIREAGVYKGTDSDANISADSTYIVNTRAANFMVMYVEGAAQATTNTLAGTNDSSQSLYIGADGSGAQGWDGLFEEVRISNVHPGVNWLVTTNNSFNAATFLTFGVEVSLDIITEVPLGTIAITGYAPTHSPLNLDIPLGTITVTGLIPEWSGAINFDVPLGVVYVTGYTPTAGYETVRIRTADGATLIGSISDGDGAIVFQDGENWYAFKLPKQT